MSFIGSGFVSAFGKMLVFKWKEQKTVALGGSTFTLTNPVLAGDTLMIFDTKYGEWIEGLHWSRNLQVITVKQLDEALTFIVYALEDV